MAAALEYGRRVGGPALRELTFHQRAALLKALGRHLREHRDELYALSARTGATLGDSKFDVDGGIGVLLGYASKAKRELPNDTVYVEGAVEPLGRGGHVRRPAHLHPAARRRGADQRVQLPGLGAAGEARARRSWPACPSLVKPASPTAYLTARLVELIVESGLLPEGALQLVCRRRRRPARPPHRAGPASRSPARRRPRPTLRTHPAVVPRSRPVQRRGRLAELLDPRPRRRARARPSSTCSSSSSSPR